MTDWSRVAEEKIQAAMQAGEFDHLPGKGKPLRLDDLSLVPEHQRMAFSLLKSNDLAPAWLELNKEVDQTLQELLRQIAGSLAETPHPAGRDSLHAAFVNRIRQLNRQILSYNVQAPSPALQRAALQPEVEWEKVLKMA